jgi:periplasmic glucans biosynthesis protein
MVKPVFSRRQFVTAVTALGIPAAASQARAQNPPAQKAFGYDDVIRRAQDLAGVALDGTVGTLPEAVAHLDFDAWRDIRFRPDKALFANSGSSFRLQTFHLGHLYRRPVTINTIRDGIATPIPYSASLFDYGRTKIEKPLPVNLGFAGFRIHYPLNDPRVFDELIAFLGASYFRFLGRRQRYGLSARGLAIATSSPTGEEFPFFREFWVETPEPNADRITIYALLDSGPLTGAYRFDVYPANETVVDVSVSLFARRTMSGIGLAPLTSMFLTGESDRHPIDDYRNELHDSDGLLIHTGVGEYIWRPLRNPRKSDTSIFIDKDVRGFGLMQRDRAFDHYQDLDLAYQLRPSYWVEPRENWGHGHVELVELPTADESNDNIVVSWCPQDPLEPGKPLSFGYRITAIMDSARLSPNGRVVASFSASARALGSSEPIPPGSRRFMIDFAGGDLAYYEVDPGLLEVVPTATAGKILRAFLVPNPHIHGIRATLDVELSNGQSTVLRAFLKAGNRALTETWTLAFTPG